MASDCDVGGAENLEVMREAENYNAFLVEQIARHLRGCPNILDFGAGNGLFAESLRDRGHTVTCVEPEPALTAGLASRGFEAHASLAPVGPDSVDGIYSLNVLEHIENDREALVSIRERIKPGGRLYVYVPAFQILYSAMDRRVGHVRRYRLKELEQKCREAGFEIEASGYADSLGFLASLAYRLIGSADGTLNPDTVRVYDRYLFPLSRALDNATRRVFGKNVWVRARRPLDKR